MKKFELIRGPRIIKQLLAEAPYSELERNTMQFEPTSKMRQHATGPIQVQEMNLIASKPSGALEVQANVNSSGKKYQSIFFFENVQFEEEDTNQNVTFTGADGQEYHIQPIPLQSTNVKVRCTCLDFRWRFSVQNQAQGSLYGPGPGIYQKKTNRAPNNPKNVPGLCKHLLKVAEELKQARIVSL